MKNILSVKNKARLATVGFFTAILLPGYLVQRHTMKELQDNFLLLPLGILIGVITVIAAVVVFFAFLSLIYIVVKGTLNYFNDFFELYDNIRGEGEDVFSAAIRAFKISMM